MERVQNCLSTVSVTNNFRSKSINKELWSHELIFRYANLFFSVLVDVTDNELLTLEIIQRYVEILDQYFGSVTKTFVVKNIEFENLAFLKIN